MRIKFPGLFTITFVLSSCLLLSSCQIGRSIFYNFAGINDYKKFPSRTINNDSTKFVFPVAETQKAPKSVSLNEKAIAFDDYLKTNHTVAFLIIRNDTIQYEKYFRGYDKSSIVASFSMAKSVTSMLIGCAIGDGLIKSVEEPVTNYLPELKNNGFKKVTIKHLLQMTSGLDFKESYFNPFGEAASFYYGRNLKKKIRRMKLKSEPGKTFEYVSGNPQLLGLILTKALKTKTVSEYFQEKIWKPSGMEYGASWSIDQKKDGLEKTFCCINARARDFAKLGRLYLNEGNCNGKQLIPREWVKESTKIDTANGSAWFYQHQWWLPSKDGDYMARGILGQYIYVNPDKKLIIVRLGKKPGSVNWSGLFTAIAADY